VPTQRLTDLTLAHFQTPERYVDLWDKTLPTFGVRISPKGTKTFVVKIRNGRRSLGRYPLLSLSEARIEAKRLLAERTLGRLRPTSVTFAEAVERFIEEKTKSRRPNTYEAYRWHLTRLPFKCYLTEISNDDIAHALKRITSRSTYDHALVAARIFFNWAMKRRYIEHNPTFGLSPHGTPERSRILTDRELKSVWRAADVIGGHYGTMIKLLILSGQRRGEIAALQTSWISHQQKTIVFPASATKNRREHCFWAGSLTLSLLTTASNQLLFSARGNSSNTFSGWSKSKFQLDKLCGFDDFTLHDLRRTFASNHARIGTPIHVVEKLLNHVSGTISGVAAVYNRHTYETECRAAQEKYEAWFVENVLGQPCGNL
jgi:integrase